MPSKTLFQNSASQRRRRPKRFPWFMLSLLVISSFGFWQGWAWWRWAVSPQMMTNQKIQVQIPAGTSTQQIGQDLEKLGLIRSRQAWALWSAWLRLSEPKGSFKAGTYQLDLQQDLPAIANTIWQGKIVHTSVTIPEGWSLRQMADYFESLGLFSAEDFLKAAQKIPRDKFPWLPPDLPYLEGFLYPDTYFLSSTEPKPNDLIVQMLERFETVALPLYKNTKTKVPLNLSLNDWVALASIVEKEAVIPAERPIIAGVFINRLQKGMKLETDPTVEYALNIRQTEAQPLTLQQIQTPSPYNTYLNTGLPPTAIASPGLESFKATLNPKKTDLLFFVAKYDGTHVFSKTLQEHEAATKKIRAAIPKT